ncbi:DUF952 domain-containing protein [uncultured Sphingomonas sp.]|uniref:DUF952 domain-containing protein n=1 Tax=uncultured Sphingomonas sp. TaxID=158754 RepID=UPI0035C96D13
MSAYPSTAYKVLTAAELAELEGGLFTGAPVDLADGFIHLSTAGQLTETVDRHFPGRADLWVVAVDLDVFADALRWEPSRGGQMFPHLFGPLPLDAVIAYSPLERGDGGIVKLPVAG